MRLMRYGMPLALGLILVCSCNRRPEGVLSDKEMVSLLADMELAESYSDVAMRGGDFIATRSKLADGVLAAHGVSRAELDTTLAWYGKNIDEYNDLFKRVDKEIDSKRKRLMANAGDDFSESADNLWPYSRQMMISHLSGVPDILFSIPATDFQKGDVVTWRMRLHNEAEVFAMLGVDYSDGSASQINRNMAGNRTIEIRVQSDTSKTVKRIYGLLRPGRTESLPLWADSISLALSPLDSTRYYQFHSQTVIKPLRRIEKKKADADSVGKKTVDSRQGMVPVQRPGTEVMGTKR